MGAKNLKTSGMLFILGGIAFFFAYFFSKQLSFVGVGVALIGVGSSFIARSKKMSKS